MRQILKQPFFRDDKRAWEEYYVHCNNIAHIIAQSAGMTEAAKERYVREYLEAAGAPTYDVGN